MSAPPVQPAAQKLPPLREALDAQRPALRQAAWLSAINGLLLLLVPSWYMFDVYGRVLDSRSLGTLAWLLAMVLGVYVVIELVDLVRGQLLHRAAVNFERALRRRVFDATFHANLRGLPGGTLTPFNDLKTLRDFGASPLVTALMDVPTAIICLVLLFALGPMLGLIALVGAGIQVWLIWLTERRTMPLLTQAIASSLQAQNYAQGAMRNAQVIESMGMLQRIHERWRGRQRLFLNRQAEASDYAGITSAGAKLLQTMQGSVLLGAATWLALHNALWGGVGMVIIASIFGGRALQPLAQLVQTWRVLIQARDAYKRLSGLLGLYQAGPPGLPLPAPQGLLTVENLVAAAPGSSVPILKRVSFEAHPGKLTLIIGPTASGKSTLARQLVGVWPAQGGSVRLDGADVHAWNKDLLGPHVGYLPQNVELFDGTVAENIARFGDVDMDAVRDAVTLVDMADIIDALPEGYATRIGDDGAVLSGGQRQRLGLARALYRRPKLVVLDEPNASLDTAGDNALLVVLTRLKMIGTTVVVISHRNTLMPATDNILILRDGQVAAFGPRDDVLAALAKANQQVRAARTADGPARTAPPSGTPPALGAQGAT